MEAIATYNLYGEKEDLPDVVHCETIFARSSLLDWELTPHRHGHLHQFLMIDTGGGEARLDNATYPLRPASLVNVPTGCVHAYTFTPGTEGWVVTVPNEVLDEGLARGEGLRPVLATPTIIDRTATHRTVIEAIFAEHEARAFGRAHVLRAQIALLAGLVARTIDAHDPHTPARHAPLVRRFLALLESHFRDHLTVADYAEQLAVTPTHLSRVLRDATGQPASAVIEERIIREARRNLAYSNLSVAQVAYDLGFQDPAYFSRVFSRATGQSPRAFRQKLETAKSG